MKQKEKNTRFPLVIVVAMAGLCLLVLLFMLGGSGDESMDAEIQAGIAYLESLEQKDPANVQAVRQQIRKAELNAQREQLLQQLNDGSIDPFSLFKDYALMGDSRAGEFWYRNFLDNSRVLSGGGHTIRNIPNQFDELVALNPSVIYLCYGLNDISIGYWKTSESYVAEYMQCIKDIQTLLPDATIVVSSILPARDPAFKVSSKWRNIPEWSDALEQACKENGILFANCDSLADAYPQLWESDGVHFREAFYPHWARILVTATLMEEL